MVKKREIEAKNIAIGKGACRIDGKRHFERQRRDDIVRRQDGLEGQERFAALADFGAFKRRGSEDDATAIYVDDRRDKVGIAVLASRADGERRRPCMRRGGLDARFRERRSEIYANNPPDRAPPQS